MRRVCLGTDPSLPAEVLVASVPVALKGAILRQLYVGGVRARCAAAAVFLSCLF
jgi:hypothetical protein